MDIDDLDHSLAELHSALAVVAKILSCAVCPKNILTAQHNINALSSLFMTIVDSLRRNVRHFDELTRNAFSLLAMSKL